jgi:hypothetical protein
VLLHDFQHATAEAASDLLNELKSGGYRVVFMKPSYDDLILKQMKASGAAAKSQNAHPHAQQAGIAC